MSVKKPLYKRKAILLHSVDEDERIKIVQFDVLKDPEKQFNQYITEGYEGAVIKNLDSNYEFGQRSKNWLKVKKGDTVDVHIIGATKSTSSIPFGALMMEKDGKYFGKVGTGFSDKEREEILKILMENQQPLTIDIPTELESEVLVTSKPFPAEIKMQEMIKRSPRAPVWVRFRWDDVNGK